MRLSIFNLSFVILLIPCGALAAQKQEMPKLAETPEEIVKAAEARMASGPAASLSPQKNTRVESKKLEGAGRQIVAVWYCPFSGRDSSYLHVYHFDEKQKRWVLFVDKLVDHAHRLSAELIEKDESLVFKGPRGDVVDTESIATLPKKQ